MNSALRQALVLVTLSLIFTLAWLVTGDLIDWPSTTRSLVAQLQTTPATPTDHATPNQAAFGQPGALDQPVNAAKRINESTAQDCEADGPSVIEEGGQRAVLLLPGRAKQDHSVRHSDYSIVQSRNPRRVGHDLDENDAPNSGEIQLAAGAAVDDVTKLERTKDGINLVVRNKDITYVFDLLNRTGLVKIVALPSVKGPITITLYDTTVDEALKAILKTHGYLSRLDGDYTLVYTQADIDELDAVAGKIEVLTYKPKYISATDLMTVLTTHLSEKGKISSTKANQMGIAANADNAGGDTLAVEDAIVVQDTHKAIERIKEIIEKLDVRPQQVLIEAVLLSVALNDDHHMGVNFALLDDPRINLGVSGSGAALNGVGAFSPAKVVSAAGKIQGAMAADDHGLKYGVVMGNVSGFVNLLESVGHTTVLASPKVLALNKQRAEIIVGQQLGYRTVTTTETASVENVQFLDVGTQLRMRPFVQPDGRIRMELHPEKSSGKVSDTTGLPEKTTTEITTNLTVKSGETIVIGGLIEEEQHKTVQQVPWLGSLPRVGKFFRDEITTTSRNEIIILITPRLIDEDEECAVAAGELERFSKTHDSLERSFPKHTRLALARQYYEKACACRDRGDLKKACEMVDLALYFDPMNEAAIKLWQELQSVNDDSVHVSAPADKSDVPQLTRVPAGARTSK